MKKLLALLVAGSFLFSFSALAAEDGSFVASKNSDKYHLATCSLAQKIDDANKVTFDKAEKAVKAGYSPCKVCNPPTKGKAYVASKGGDKYHLASCTAAQRIETANLVVYSTKKDAEKEGYKPCQICLSKSE